MQAMNGMRTSRARIAMVLVALSVIGLSVEWGTSLASGQETSKRAFAHPRPNASGEAST